MEEKVQPKCPVPHIPITASADKLIRLWSKSKTHCMSFPCAAQKPLVEYGNWNRRTWTSKACDVMGPCEFAGVGQAFHRPIQSQWDRMLVQSLHTCYALTTYSTYLCACYMLCAIGWGFPTAANPHNVTILIPSNLT